MRPMRGRRLSRILEPVPRGRELRSRRCTDTTPSPSNNCTKPASPSCARTRMRPARPVSAAVPGARSGPGCSGTEGAGTIEFVATRVSSPRLIGRDAELEVLEAAFKVAATEERASTYLVGGEAGVGKTRLVTELGAR